MATGTYNVTTIIIIIKTLKKLFYKYECVIRKKEGKEEGTFYAVEMKYYTKNIKVI